jgi:hypothetical protein
MRLLNLEQSADSDCDSAHSFLKLRWEKEEAAFAAAPNSNLRGARTGTAGQWMREGCCERLR